jgi:mRNA interferase YafQ
MEPMRKIEMTGGFRRDLKRELRGRYGDFLEKHFEEIARELAMAHEFPTKFRDHALKADWNKHRDCHLQPDLVLIYHKNIENELWLVRLGSHSELNLA